MVDVPAKNKKASSVFVSKKCQFAEQQNQLGNLRTLVAAHSDALCLLINVLSRNKKVWFLINLFKLNKKSLLKLGKLSILQLVIIAWMVSE